MSWKPIAVGVVLGAIIAGGILSAKHLYYDHLNLHNIATALRRAQQAAQAPPGEAK